MVSSGKLECSNHRDLVVESFFYSEFLKLEVNILFVKYAASSVLKLIVWYGLWKWKPGNCIDSNSFSPFRIDSS